MRSRWSGSCVAGSCPDEDEPFPPGQRPPARRIAGLPAAWREALVLRHMHDLPVEEVARIMDVPAGTVKTWLHRARGKLAVWSQGEDA
ncbi:MAG: sigma-70 region 4 domain-containing protein [Candidatus Sericytochromatia bacterium]|nr:sigma-70 region 4 domain-containing protein [Candidatus Tanganyikabacteria bacterium]